MWRIGARTHGRRWQAGLLVGLFAVPAAAEDAAVHAGGPVVRAALEEMEVLRSARRVAARPVELVAPYFSAVGGAETTVLLLNTFADPMTAEVLAVNPAGGELSIGFFTVEPTRHLAVPVRELLAGAPASYSSGSLRVRFHGDFEMLQAWAMVAGAGGAVEVPFTGIGKSLSRALVSAWDVRRLRGRAEPRYDLVNGGSQPLTVTVGLAPGSGSRPERTLRRTLAPGGHLAVLPLALAPGLRAGALRIAYDGEPGTLAVSGLLTGTARAALPLALPGDPEQGSEYHTVGLPRAAPQAGQRPARPILVLHNLSESGQNIEVAILDQASGAELQAVERRLRGGEVDSLELPSSAAEVRLRVRGERALQVAGWVEQPGGELTDVGFFARSEAHKNGSYPLLPRAEAEVATTLVNLGQKPARVLAQIFWQTGAYSLPPIEIAPGEGYRLDPAALAAEGPTDILGRTLDPAYEGGFLQWVAEGGHELIARTEARAHGSADVVGFSCFGCCSRNSSGSVMPGTINFGIGETPYFWACETITTCNSVLGPYPATITSLTYAAPFSWDGVRVSASAAAFQGLRFDGVGEKIFDLTTCEVEEKGIFGRGDADTCQKTHNPRNYKADKTCSSQTSSCEECHLCCSHVNEQEVCRCGGTQACRLFRDGEKRTCDGHCNTDHCT